MRRRIYTHEECCVICHRTECEDVNDPDADIIGVTVEKVVCPQCAEAVGFVKDNLDSLKAILNHFVNSDPPAEIPVPDGE